MDYYIKGEPARAKEIKAAFEQLGFDPAGWDCDGAHSVYFTVPGDNKVKSVHISIGKIIMTHPDYQELELPTKPNLKVGDWVVTDYGKVSQIVSVDKDGDGYTLDDGVYFSGSWCDMYHHWDIQDVKDGDVLTDGKKIVIFNKFEEPTSKQRIIAYAGLDLSGKLQITEETKDSWRLAADRIMPATKESRDLLFQKIKEAGYQWDTEKKELHKIIKPKFKVGDWLWHKTKGVFPMMVEDYDEKEGYLMQFTDEAKCYFGRDIIENDYRLWNFRDSKVGDILYDKAYNRIGIFENFGHHPDGGSFNDKTYCYLIIYYDIDDKELYEEVHNDMDGSDAVPATKEQRDLLFAKMQESGYQWDAEKKELKKIQHYDIARFYAGMPVLVRDSDNSEWKYVAFSHYREEGTFCACGSYWYQCIPFNEDTEHLLGTTDMCPEEYVNW